METSTPSNIIQLLHNQITKNNKRDYVNKVPKFYPSSVGKCSRAIVYQMLGYPSEEFKPDFLFILENGNYYHERIENLFKTTGLMIAPELSIKEPNLRISGRSDVIIKNFLPHESSNNIIKLYKPLSYKEQEANKEPEVLWEGPDNDVIIVELKSINEKGFARVFRYGAKEEHILQLQLYMYLTGIRVGSLLYENKNNQQLLEFIIPYNDEIVNKIINKIKNVNKHVDNETFPEKEFEKTDFECRYCDYKDICWPEANKVSIDDII